MPPKWCTDATAQKLVGDLESPILLRGVNANTARDVIRAAAPHREAAPERRGPGYIMIRSSMISVTCKAAKFFKGCAYLQARHHSLEATSSRTLSASRDRRSAATR